MTGALKYGQKKMQSNMLDSSFSDTLEQLVRFDMSREAMLTSLLFSAAGALLLSRFTGAIGHLTLPLNFSALFIGTGSGQLLLDGIDVPAIQYEQEVLIVYPSWASSPAPWPCSGASGPNTARLCRLRQGCAAKTTMLPYCIAKWKPECRLTRHPTSPGCFAPMPAIRRRRQQPAVPHQSCQGPDRPFRRLRPADPDRL